MICTFSVGEILAIFYNIQKAKEVLLLWNCPHLSLFIPQRRDSECTLENIFKFVQKFTNVFYKINHTLWFYFRNSMLFQVAAFINIGIF